MPDRTGTAPSGYRRAWPVLVVVAVYACLATDAVAQGSVETDRMALQALYDATGGEAWWWSKNWKTDAPLGEWFGVTTDAAGRVTTLGFKSNRLRGPIPPELGSLSRLESLSLDFNQLTGTIPPELARLSNLEHLSLVRNQLTGTIPPELGNLSNLEYLSLHSNKLTGTIPPELARLSNLEYLSLNFNQLTGTIPPELARLSNLEYLSLNFNQLTGTIPESLENLSNLVELRLHYNQLTGTIPPELARLSNLEYLSLNFNQLTGTIPPELARLSNLEYLSLIHNQLTGTIPESLSGLTNLESLGLSSNALTGPIPESLSGLTNLESLGLSGNALTGIIPPELARLSNLEHLSLGANALTGPIPPELGNLSGLISLTLRQNALTGPIPPELGNLSNLFGLFINDNGLTGPIPESLGNLPALAALYLHSNALTGPIPPELGNLSNLLDLHLAFNDLTGSIPDSLGNLSRLDNLDLRGNALTGPIPESLGSLSILRYLGLGVNELTGPIPESLGRLSNLRVMFLGVNKLTGPIPESLGRLSKLELLYLGSNTLTGPIPAELGSLSLLTYLGLGVNKLTGPIPESLGRMSSLRQLDLRENALTGPIPAELGSLSLLTYLGLGVNKLTGPIPESLGRMSSLRQLDLRENALTGPIPESLGNLPNLTWLGLSYNWGLSGPLPARLRQSRLGSLDIWVTQMCAPADWQAWVRTINFSGALCGVETDVTIDVAVVYTPAAREAAGGTAAIEAEIDLMIAETNQAYAASGVHHRVALVDRAEVPYTETGDASIDLERLKIPWDGHMDGVHAMRNRTGADLVHLLFHHEGEFEVGDIAGIAEFRGPFGLTCQGCDGSIFAHEMGHNMGLRHDRYQAQNTDDLTLLPHPGYGYVNQRTFEEGAPPSSAWMTVMASGTQCGDAGKICPRLLRFSNPRQTWMDDPLGVPFDTGASGVTGPADAVTVLNVTGSAVAAWKGRIPSVTIPPPLGTESFSIPDRGGQSVTSSGTGEAVRTGYGEIRAEAGSATPSGIALFQFRDSEGVLVSEAGVSAVEPIQKARVFAEVKGPVNTGLAMANPNDRPATITFYFTDTEGERFAEGQFELGAHRQTAKFLDQDPFNSGEVESGTFTFTSSVPIAVIALRGLTNRDGEFLMTTLPVTTLAARLTPFTTERGSTDTVYFPHFTDGNGWVTQVILVNPTDETIAGKIQFVDQGSRTAPAAPAILTLDDGQTGSEFPYSIPARSSRRFTTSNPAGRATSGSVRATPDPGSYAPSGLVVFSFTTGGKTVSEVGVNALTAGSAFRLYAESSGTPGQVGSIRTGLAITNAADTDNMVTLEVTGLDGAMTMGVAPVTLPLPPSGQVARFVDEIFDSLPDNFSGVLRVTSTADVAIVGLRLHINDRGELKMTTTPPSDETGAPTMMDRYFPHIVDSAGWSTQFILFSGTAGEASSGTLSFIDTAGEPWDLPTTQP